MTGSSALGAATGAATRGATLSLTLADGSVHTAGMDSVESIEQQNGPVSWLASRTPGANVQTPYWGEDEPWPARMGATVDGKAIRIGDAVYPHGIGVHAYSRLEYPLDGRYARFRTGFGVAGDLPLADVTVRVKLDGKTAFEQAHVRAGQAYEPVSIDLGDAKTLTLEVDYGANGDYQDRAEWLDPALVGKKE
jgi:hypothetical protein